MKNNLALIIKNLTFDYVNSNITKDNFPEQPLRGRYELFTLDHPMKTAEIEAAMVAKGFLPANLYELLDYAKDGWNNKDWVFALGSGWVGSDGLRRVPGLGRDGSGRYLSLRWDGPSRTWSDSCQFLVVVVSKSLDTHPLDPSVLGRLADLERHVAQLEKRFLPLD